MKKITFLIAVSISSLLFSCKKDTIAPDTTNSETTASNSLGDRFKVSSSTTLATITDDTYTLQTQLNAGNVTLTAGRVYNVTGLTVTHALNMNGATINMTATSGAAVKLTASGASVTNGTINGTWNNTTSGNASGVIGMRILANNCSISKVNVSSFSSYGILVGPYSNSSVTYCTIQNTGYIAFYFDPEKANINGGTLSNNVIDRSMLPPSTIMGLAVGVRGSTNNSAYTTSNWTITGNTIKMPYLPTDWGAECIETRYCNNSLISQNTLVGGSIGVSAVRSSGVTVSGNSFSNSQLEGLEFADCSNSTSQSNVITSSAGAGILLDGSAGCSGITLTGDKVSGTAKECIHTYTNTQGVTISGCTLTASAGTTAINLQRSNQVNIQNTAFNGNGSANTVIMLDTCPGNVTMTGGSISSFGSNVVSIYNATAGLVTNNVTMSGVTVTTVPKALSTCLANGGSIGSNIIVYNQ